MGFHNLQISFQPTRSTLPENPIGVASKQGQALDTNHGENCFTLATSNTTRKAISTVCLSPQAHLEPGRLTSAYPPEPTLPKPPTRLGHEQDEK